MTKKNATTSKSADGKTWVMPEAKPKAVKKGKKAKATTKKPVEKKAGKRTPALLVLGERMPKTIEAAYKGTVYTASVLADGKVQVNGMDCGDDGFRNVFNSPSRAGKAVTGKEVDGWTFWSYEVPGEGLKKLDTMRKETE